MKKSLKHILVLSLSSTLVLTTSLPVLVQATDDNQAGSQAGSNDNSDGGSQDDSGVSTDPVSSTEPKEPATTLPNGAVGISDVTVAPDPTTTASDDDESSEDGEASEAGSQDAEDDDEAEATTQAGQGPSTGSPVNVAPAPAPTATPIALTPGADTPESSDESEAVDLASLFGTANDNPAFVKAYENQQEMLASLSIKDMKNPDSIGSSSQDVIDYMGVNPDDQAEEAGRLAQAYHYDIDGASAQLVTVFQDDQLVAIYLLDIDQTRDLPTTLSEEGVQAIAAEDTGVNLLQEEVLPVLATGQFKQADKDIYYLLVAAGSQEVPRLELFLVDGQDTDHLGQADFTDNPMTMVNFMNGKLFAPDQAEASEEVSQESSEGESQVEDRNNTENTPEESSQAPQADTGTANFAEAYAPEGDYTEADLVAMADLEAGYADLKTRLDAGEQLTADQVMEFMGQATIDEEVGTSRYLRYYAIEDDKVSILDYQFAEGGNSLLKVNYEVLTPELEGGFPINVAELTDLVSQDPDYDKLQEKLGQPSLVEHLIDSDQVRYLWARGNDSEMSHIEAIHHLDSDDFLVYYYSKE